MASCARYISQTEFQDFLENYCENADSSSKDCLYNWILDGKHNYALWPLTQYTREVNFSVFIDALHDSLLKYMKEYDIEPWGESP
jgi:hypothetical protein